MGCYNIFKRNKKKEKGSTWLLSGARILTTENNPSGATGPLTESQPVAEIQPLAEVLASAEIETDAESQPVAGSSSSIWTDAYAKLKEDQKELVERYETILKSLVQDDSSNDIATAKRPLPRNGESAEIQKMKNAMQLGLDRTEREAKIKGRFGEMTGYISIIQPIINKAVKPSTEAALVWSCFSFGLEMLANPITESAAQRDGVEYVITRIDWYLYLSEEVLIKGRASSELQASIRSKLITLYTGLLSFLMESICLYHQSRFLATLRDFFKVENWEGRVKDIKDNEAAVERDLDQYNATEFREKLEAISKSTAGVWDELKTWRAQGNKEKCLEVIRRTIPSFTKAGLLTQKGNLLPQCCDWFFRSDEFNVWKSEPQSRILWISCAPGKGKTMLLCAIAEWFQYGRCLTYFFCKETDKELNKEEAILRGLIYTITDKIPALLKHVQDNLNGLRLQGAPGMEALCKTLTSILRDPLTSDAIILIDALDECTQSAGDGYEAPDRILSLIEELAAASSAKWIISSRGTLSAVELRLGSTPGFLHLNLEDASDAISDAVAEYVRTKVAAPWGKGQRSVNSDERSEIERQLVSGASKTFLWVSLVWSDILKTLRKQVLGDPVQFILKQIKTMPPDLNDLYTRILGRIPQGVNSEHDIDVKDILKIIYVTRRTLTIWELQYLLENRNLRTTKDLQGLRAMFSQTSAFLAVENNVISFIHQTVKDFITEHGSDPEVAILPKDVSLAHRALVYRSMENIAEIQENIFGIEHPGTTRGEVIQPDDSPLAHLGYSCAYWAHHLPLSTSPIETVVEEKIHTFLSKHLLRWMEALAWLEELSAGEELLDKVKVWITGCGTSNLQNWISDAYRFYVKFCPVVAERPLQVYVSALVFAPSTSLVKNAYRPPEWITHVSGIDENWNPFSATIESPDDEFYDICWLDSDDLVAHTCGESFEDRRPGLGLSRWSTKTGSRISQTPQSEQLKEIDFNVSRAGDIFASIGSDSILVWDVVREDLQKFELVEDGHKFDISAVALSHDGQHLLASCSSPPCLHIWDLNNRGEADRVSWERQVHLSEPRSKVAFLTGTLFVSTFNKTIHIEDVKGEHYQRLEADHRVTTLIPCRERLSWFVTADEYGIVQLWDASIGKCLRKFDNYDLRVGEAWKVSSDGSMFAFTGMKRSKYEPNSCFIESYPLADCLKFDSGQVVRQLAFSNDNKLLASANKLEPEICIWDTAHGTRLMVLRCHRRFIWSLSFSPDSRRLASASGDSSIRIWELAAFKAPTEGITQYQDYRTRPPILSFSPDGQRLCSVAISSTPHLWSNKGPDPNTPQKDVTWTRDGGLMSKIFFSPDGSKFALIQGDECTLEIWDALQKGCSLNCILNAEKCGLKSMSSVSLSHKGDLIALNSGTFLVIWSLDRHCQVSTLDFDHVAKDAWNIESTKFLEDDRHLVSASLLGHIIISDTNGKHHNTIKGTSNGFFAFEAKSDRLVLLTPANIRVWHMRSPTDITRSHWLNIDREFKRIAFHPLRSSVLFTNRGMLDLDKPKLESDESPGDEQLSFQGYGMNETETWITRDGKEVMWLPQEYRPGPWYGNNAFWGSMIAIGSVTGHLLVLHFSEH